MRSGAIDVSPLRPIWISPQVSLLMYNPRFRPSRINGAL
jgi:hypothetical protein